MPHHSRMIFTASAMIVCFREPIEHLLDWDQCNGSLGQLLAHDRTLRLSQWCKDSSSVELLPLKVLVFSMLRRVLMVALLLRHERSRLDHQLLVHWHGLLIPRGGGYNQCPRNTNILTTTIVQIKNTKYINYKQINYNYCPN